MTSRRAAQFPVLQVVPPSNNVSASDLSKLIQPFDAGELHEILKCISMVPLRLRISDIGEPYDLGGHFSQTTEVGRRQELTIGEGCSG